jgi:hypothetical protein
MILDYVGGFFFLYFLFDCVCENVPTHTKAWFLSFVVSSVLSYEAIVYSIPSIDFQNTAAQSFSSTPRSDIACDIFLAFCIADLVCGAFSYPKDMKLVEGVLHHILYSLLILFLRQKEWTCLFWLCTFCELPTCIMAAGKLFGLKTTCFNAVQCIVFWIFRIVLYGVFAFRFFMTLDAVHLWWTLPIFSLIMSAHLKWGIFLIKKLV